MIGLSTRRSTTVLLVIVLTVQSHLVRESWRSKSERSKSKSGGYPTQGAPAPASHARASFNTSKSNSSGERWRSKLEEAYSARREARSVERFRTPDRSANAPAHREAAGVDCGRKRSPSCGECPQSPERGVYDCGGDCHWDEETSQCLAGATETITAFNVVSEGQVTYLHELLSAVTRAFDAHGVKYWLSSGTLLGAMRNRPPGILRWDDDLDIGVTNVDFPKAFHAIVAARNPRIDCIKWDEEYWDGRKCGLRPDNSTKVQGRQFALDISVWRYVKNCRGTTMVDEHCGKGPNWNIYSSARRKADWFTKRYFLASEVESTVPCQFWDLTLQCPRNSVAYLERAFGANVMNEVMIESHSARKGPVGIALDVDEVNDHEAFMPGLNRELMEKLMANPNVDDVKEDG